MGGENFKLYICNPDGSSCYPAEGSSQWLMSDVGGSGRTDDEIWYINHRYILGGG